MTKDKSAAILTIKTVSEMTKSGKRRVAKWLRDRVDDLEKHGHEMVGKRFTARYMYRDGQV